MITIALFEVVDIEENSNFPFFFGCTPYIDFVIIINVIAIVIIIVIVIIINGQCHQCCYDHLYHYHRHHHHSLGYRHRRRHHQHRHYQHYHSPIFFQILITHIPCTFLFKRVL